MNILLTGASGFLGHHMVKRITQEIEKINEQKNYEGQELYKLFTPSSAQMNCLDYQELYYYCYYNDITSIIHLAAECGGIGINQRKPADFFLNNAQMSLNVIRVTNERPEIRKTVTLGTVCSYPKHTPVPFKEEDLWNGYPEETNAPYGLAKKNLLVGAQAFHQQYNENIIHLIPVNMYGEHDHFDLENSHVIPAMLRKFYEAKEKNEPAVCLWGDGSASREFLYAGDCADAIWKAFCNYDSPEPINLGAAKETSIKELAETVKKLVGYEGEIVWDAARPNGQPRRCLDTSKAKEKFGFEAKTSLEEGLEKTYNWYIAQQNEINQ